GGGAGYKGRVQGSLFADPDTTYIAKPTKPFLKWAGGKSQLLREITSLLPDAFSCGQDKFEGHYFEPFVGSGAVFFHVRPSINPVKTRLSDVNGELIVTYIALRDHLDLVLDVLKGHEYEHN